MAIAFVPHLILPTYDPTFPTQIRVDYNVAYMGVDVPGNVILRNLQTIYTRGDSLATFATNVRTDIQVEATKNGFTVANGSTVIPTYQTI